MRLEGKIPVVFFKEGKQVIAYCYALDLSTCGTTKLKAEKAFTKAVHGFFEEVVSMGTVDEVLKDLGWKIVRNQWIAPSFVGQKDEKISVALA